MVGLTVSGCALSQRAGSADAKASSLVSRETAESIARLMFRAAYPDAFDRYELVISGDESRPGLWGFAYQGPSVHDLVVVVVNKTNAHSWIGEFGVLPKKGTLERPADRQKHGPDTNSVRNGEREVNAHRN